MTKMHFSKVKSEMQERKEERKGAYCELHYAKNENCYGVRQTKRKGIVKSEAGKNLKRQTRQNRRNLTKEGQEVCLTRSFRVDQDLKVAVHKS